MPTQTTIHYSHQDVLWVLIHWIALDTVAATTNNIIPLSCGSDTNTSHDKFCISGRRQAQTTCMVRSRWSKWRR